MPVRKIIHIDMDCFYAAIEMRENPHLQGKPVAVGGLPSQRGVLSTCNYEARRFGLHSAMPSVTALRKCPHLILLKGNMPLYRRVSAQIQHIFRRFTDLIEPLSLDEAYLDVTDCCECNGSATWIAQAIRQAIFAETQLTASAGVAPLKFLAKIASDMNKPNGQYVITPEQVDAFIQTLPLAKIPGVGKVTAQKLNTMGLINCGDIQQMSQHILLDTFGKLGQRIWQFSHGIDTRPVQPKQVRKSISVETTLLRDIDELNEANRVLDQLYDALLARVQSVLPDRTLRDFHHLGIKLKFSDFHVTTLENRMLVFSKAHFQQLLAQIWQRRKNRAVRLIGLQIVLSPQARNEQLSFWS
ncbi:DNA polymerase IV [Spirabiliibacterium falconis]|uniref:DNA polymerase IV n=1 Tax=Spirabiliibacterium falconis TaxID=572023 RepID=UPI001AAD6F66|nr:DNA polymerase IV [Spirabiliibacterium falconis]MBE2894194.1 DNA polymerase IV [Spirabiliibacterium falconis]